MVVDTIHPRYDPATIALALSTRLVARGQQKALMNMTSGLEMMAMGITVCREVSNFI
jgi:hypothetical protein